MTCRWGAPCCRYDGRSENEGEGVRETLGNRNAPAVRPSSHRTDRGVTLLKTQNEFVIFNVTSVEFQEVLISMNSKNGSKAIGSCVNVFFWLTTH